jgi:C4-type Zn-finger protein
MDTQSFDITLRVTGLAIQPGGYEQLYCPVCQSPLNIHQPEEEVPNRLLASCTCEECGLWLSLLMSPDRTKVYMIRLPVMVEMWEALSRQGLV